MGERVYRTVTDYSLGQLEHAPSSAELEEKARYIARGVGHAHERDAGKGWPAGSRVEAQFHGIRELQSGVWRVVSDWTVHGPLSEQAVTKLAADKAYLLRWSIYRDYPRSRVEMNHYGIRLLSEAPAAPTPEPSPPSSP